MSIVHNTRDFINRYHGDDELAKKFHGDALVWAKEERRLPLAYQEIEYVEADGRQFFYTGVIWDKTIIVTDDVVYTSNASNNISGIYGGAYYGVNKGKWYIGGADGAAYTTNTEAKVLYDASTNTIYNSLTQVVVRPSSMSVTTENEFDFVLFSLANNSTGVETATYRNYCKRYQTTIYKDGECVRNFVPCYRKSDKKVGMFDTVNGVFYVSATSVDFIAGPVVECESLKYVANTNQNFINTHYKNTTSDIVSFKVERTGEIGGNSDYPRFYGKEIGNGTTGYVAGMIGRTYGKETRDFYYSSASSGYISSFTTNALVVEKTTPATVYFTNELKELEFYVFTSNRYNFTISFSNWYGRMYYLKCGDALNLVPYKIGSRVGMLNKVNGVLYTGEYLSKPFVAP